MAGLPPEQQEAVSLRYGALAQRAFARSLEEVQTIVETLASVGLLELSRCVSAPGGNRTRGLRFERPLLFGSPKRTVDH